MNTDEDNQRSPSVFSPDHANHLLQAAIRIFHRGDMAQADELCDQILSNIPLHFDALYCRGMIARKQGKPYDAEKFLLSALKIRNDCAPIYSSYGLVLHDLNRLDEAESCYKKSIILDPGLGAAYYNAGITLEHLGYLETALSFYEKAVSVQPDNFDVWNNRGNVLKALNRIEESLFSYEHAINLKPDYPIAYNNRGVVLKDLNRVEEALFCYDCAVIIDSRYFAAYNNRGVVLQKLDRSEDALIDFDKAISLNSSFAIAYYNRGANLENLNKIEEALKSYSDAISIRPDYLDAYHNKANILKKTRRHEEALLFYDTAILLSPHSADIHNSRAVTLHEAGRYGEALESFTRAIWLKPDFAIAYCNFGLTSKTLRFFDEAISLYNKAIYLQSDYAEAFNNRGVAFQDLKRFDEALESFEAALDADPCHFNAHSNLLFTMNYVPSLTIEGRVNEAKNFGKRVSGHAYEKFTSWFGSFNSEKLKVGFVSGDFRNHPVGYFLEGFLSKLNKSKFVLFAYSTHLEEDDLTENLKKHFSVWRPVANRKFNDVARLIHSDGLHILIDLAGHTAGNLLPAFAYKPAPVQASWLGYFATTGLPEIDYFIGDPYVAPESEQHHFIENIARLPETYFCFTPPQVAVNAGPLPAQKNGFVTFGCFNNLAKLNLDVVLLWSRILNAIEGSRLFLKSGQLGDRDIVRSTVEMFAMAGVGQDRLILEGPSNRKDYFLAFNRVDIALDPFPFPGGTTSIEGLWMGVPVITLRGDRFIAHNGETIAHNTGQSSWIADNEADYLAKAIFFSSHLKELSEIRSGLRSKILSSPLFDSDRFAQNFEDILTFMWKDFLKMRASSEVIDE